MGKTKIPNINDWKNDNTVIEGLDNQVVIHFENVFKDEAWAPFDTFYMTKRAYVNQLDFIVKYIDYFMRFYDTDQELILGYLKMKYEIDVNHKYSIDNIDALVKDLYDIIFTPSVEKNIDRLVDYNNHINIEREEDGSKKYKTARKYIESLEFNNEHVRLMFKISFCMKIITPIMMHFFVVQRIKLNDNDHLIFKFFEPLMGNRFSDTINIYNKLYVYVKAKIQENRSQNSQMYDRRDIYGVDIITLTQEFLRKKLIVENMFKYNFADNPVAFNKVIINFQLNCLFRNKDSKNMTLLSNEQDGEGLSGMEKLEMNMSKIDEGMTILADLDTISGIKTIQNIYRFDIPDEEIGFMMKNHNPCDIQQSLITAFFSEYFGESRNIKLTNKRQYCILALTLKKILLTADANENGDTNISFLPFIITGNLQGNQEDRIIRNSKFINKLESSSAYQSLVNGKFKCIEEVRKNSIINIISTLANSTFTYCAYEYPELMDTKIDTNLNKLAMEVIELLSAI